MLAEVMPEISRPTNSQIRLGRQRHEDVVEAEPEIREQDHRPAAEAVRQRALHRREHELHQRPGGAEQAEDLRRARGVAAEEIDHQLGQHRNDHAERQHVEQHGDEDEDEGRARAPQRRRSARRALAFARLVEMSFMRGSAGFRSVLGKADFNAPAFSARNTDSSSRATSAGSACRAGRSSRADC